MSPTSPDCPENFQLFACAGFIGCSTTKTCYSHHDDRDDSPDTYCFNTTYSYEGKYYADSNHTRCDNPISPIVGCCKNGTNNCAHSCPPENLTQSFLSVIPDAIVDHSSSYAQTDLYTIWFYELSPTFTPEVYVPGEASTPTVDTLAGEPQMTSTTQGLAPSTSVSSTTEPAATGGQSALQTAQPGPKSNTAAIAGGVAGGCVGLALLVGILVICCRRRITKPRQHMNEARSPTWALGKAPSRTRNDSELEEMKQGPSPSKLRQLSLRSYVELIASFQQHRHCIHLPPHLRLCFRLYHRHPYTRHTSRSAMSEIDHLIILTHLLAPRMHHTIFHLQSRRPLHRH